MKSRLRRLKLDPPIVTFWLPSGERLGSISYVRPTVTASGELAFIDDETGETVTETSLDAEGADGWSRYYGPNERLWIEFLGDSASDTSCGATGGVRTLTTTACGSGALNAIGSALNVLARGGVLAAVGIAVPAGQSILNPSFVTSVASKR